jgi:nitronate monooxygenase
MSSDGEQRLRKIYDECVENCGDEKTMNLPTIIQGGMGVAISNWTLAQAVSKEGQLGVVSGTGIALVMIARLMDGDKGGHVRRALSHFPYQEAVEHVMAKYFLKDGRRANQAYLRPEMWTPKVSLERQRLTVLANFMEVFLAKEGHTGKVGINLLEKIQMPVLASLYGAMLAGVDAVIMGAGIPLQVPAVLDGLVEHQPVSYRLDVKGAGREDEYRMTFDPLGILAKAKAFMGSLPRPSFLPVVSSLALAKTLIRRTNGNVDGFVVEAPTAGGHNAPPRGALTLNEQGEPVYGPRDDVDFEELRGLGLPFWLAGGYDSPQGLKQAFDVGAAGIQVGTAFAFCNESGMEAALKQQVLDAVRLGDIQVYTDPNASPTGFPFKVVQLDGSLSETDLYNQRRRICDIGLLRQLHKNEDASLSLYCPAAPIKTVLDQGGNKEDTLNKTCLCNNLLATAGYPQLRADATHELPLVTAGDTIKTLNKYLGEDKTSYSAKDVLTHLMPN